MIEERLWIPRRHKKTGVYRSWRPRKEFYGEMQQFDGSYHLWFESRYKDRTGNPIEVCLLVSVDDATGRITKACFAENEGVVAVFNFWKRYILTQGKPVIIYLDKFSTYKINHKAAENNKELMTQFERACLDLNIQLINAESAEAKGRVERMFGTLQDRLVKEMRLAHINNPCQGNKFLSELFIFKFNARFAVIAQKSGDVHRALTDADKKNLHHIFSIQFHRVINNDFTIQFKSNWYQLLEIQPITVRPKETVTVEKWLNGKLYFTLKGVNLNYFVLPMKPEKMKTNPVILTKHPLNWKPAVNHPWRLRARAAIEEHMLKKNDKF